MQFYGRTSKNTAIGVGPLAAVALGLVFLVLFTYLFLVVLVVGAIWGAVEGLQWLGERRTAAAARNAPLPPYGEVVVPESTLDRVRSLRAPRSPR